MVRYAVLAGLALGLGTSAVVTYQPARQPITIPSRVAPFATNNAPPASDPDGSFAIEVDGVKYGANRYANDIPFYMQGGKVISINGNVSKIGD